MVIKCIFQVGRQGKRQRFTLLINPKKLHFLLGLINKLGKKKKERSGTCLNLTGIAKELHLHTARSGDLSSAYTYIACAAVLLVPRCPSRPQAVLDGLRGCPERLWSLIL